ncbi:MAG: type I-C CRISPR-associated protein Cas8c/Csd1 [Fimbriiglobus sp.]
MVSARGIEGFTRALNALIGNKLPSAKQSAVETMIRIGGKSNGVMFVFWTRDPADLKFMRLFDDPTDAETLLPPPKKPLRSRDLSQVHNLYAAPLTGLKTGASTLKEDSFYLLAISGNLARVVVRGYLEKSLGEVKQNVADWFADLRIADTSKDRAGQPNDKFPLWQLTLATAFDSDAVAPATGERLLTAALSGGPVPESLLALCLRRLTAEGTAAFRASRMALVKLILIRRGIPVDETLNPKREDPAYVYGRALAVLEQIQYAALGDVNANVVDKFYGTMSAAPGMVFGRLQDNARNHLRKLRGEKPGVAVALEQRLMALCGLLDPVPPPRQFSLQDQGLFSLGYYHEKAKGFEQAAERRAAKAAADASN